MSGTPLTGGWRDDPAWPDVDVVMPIRNEFDHLEAAVASVRAQEYPGKLRIFLAVGPSDDGTEALAERLAAESDDLVVVPNPSGTIPAGLNLAIAEGTAPVVVRVDGHSALSNGYVERAVQTLRRTGAANVGGRQVPVADTPFQQHVVSATTSWIGTGGAAYRTGGAEGPVDTVYLGVYDRRALDDVGRYDEELLANEDYELNIRLRAADHLVWLDPELSVGYRPRSSWPSLARQYRGYGRWKAAVARKHPGSLRLRQSLPPLAVGAAVFGLVGGTRWRGLLALPAGYVAVLAAASRCRPGVMGVSGTMHVSWSIGFVTGWWRNVRTAR